MSVKEQFNLAHFTTFLLQIQLDPLNRLLPGPTLQTAARMSTSATMESVYTCGTFAMAVMTVETTRMKDGFAVCSYVVVNLKRRIPLM